MIKIVRFPLFKEKVENFEVVCRFPNENLNLNLNNSKIIITFNLYLIIIYFRLIKNRSLRLSNKSFSSFLF